jgi:hypothetical protein
MIILNQDELAHVLRQRSGNPFLDALVDMQDLFNTISLYYKHKPYIDKYSDTTLSDLKDKIKTHLPDAIDKNGNIDFSKIEELAKQGNKMAETILGIRQARENFANASIGGKLATFLDEKLQPQLDILSGNILSKEATVLKNLEGVEKLIKNSKLPDEIKAVFLANKEALANPQVLATILPFFTLQQDQQQSNQQQPSNPQQVNNITFQPPPIKNMRAIVEESLKPPKVNYDNPYEVAQEVLEDPRFKSFVEKQKKKSKSSGNKKSKVSEKLKNSETDIISYLKSLPSYPPVLYSSNQIQGSPQWQNNILAQILNPRPLF